MPVYAVGSDGYIVQPKVLLRTEAIKRTVFLAIAALRDRLLELQRQRDAVWSKN
jgi:hypothetical protein